MANEFLSRFISGTKGLQDIEKETQLAQLREQDVQASERAGELSRIQQPLNVARTEATVAGQPGILQAEEQSREQAQFKQMEDFVVNNQNPQGAFEQLQSEGTIPPTFQFSMQKLPGTEELTPAFFDPDTHKPGQFEIIDDAKQQQATTFRRQQQLQEQKDRASAKRAAIKDKKLGKAPTKDMIKNISDLVIVDKELEGLNEEEIQAFSTAVANETKVLQDKHAGLSFKIAKDLAYEQIKSAHTTAAREDVTLGFIDEPATLDLTKQRKARGGAGKKQSPELAALMSRLKTKQ